MKQLLDTIRAIADTPRRKAIAAAQHRNDIERQWLHLRQIVGDDPARIDAFTRLAAVDFPVEILARPSVVEAWARGRLG